MAKKERSSPYPGADLASCVDAVEKFKKQLGTGSHDATAIAGAIANGKVTGPLARKIAAMVYFGLLEKSGKEYRLSDNSSKITNPFNVGEKESTIREAFTMPKLYATLLEKYSGEGEVPRQISNILHREHGIAESASKFAADIFLRSGQYAGVLDTDGRFVDDQDKNEEEQTEPDDIVQGNARHPLGLHNRGSGTDRDGQMQHFVVALTNGRSAVLDVPALVNKRDVSILKKQLETLELQASYAEEPVE